MSRSYRVSVKESVNQIIKCEDEVSTHLDIMEILPPEDMGALLEKELEKKGFEKNGDVMSKTEDGITVTINPVCGEVVVTTESSQRIREDQTVDGSAYDDMGPSSKKVEDQLRQQAKQELEKKVKSKTDKLQGEVTEKLETHLNDIKEDLDQVVNKVTADALKIKAKSMGQIKELTEDDKGNMTIVVEV